MKTRIREIRCERGLKQEDVAAILNMTASGYSLIENGKRKLTADVLVKLSAELNVSVDSLLGTDFALSSESPQYQVNESLRATLISATDRLDKISKVQVQNLINSFMSLSPEGRAKLADNADDLVRSGKYSKTRISALQGRDNPVQAASA